jgi:hypothetical protein
MALGLCDSGVEANFSSLAVIAIQTAARGSVDQSGLTVSVRATPFLKPSGRRVDLGE